MSHQLKISKEEINLLPKYVFEGTVVLIESREEAIKAVEILKKETVLGFDTETKTAFKKGERYNISLLQLSNGTHAYLFRLHQIEILSEIIGILSDPNIIKAGVAVAGDIKGLKKMIDFENAGFVDLAKVAQERKIQNFGLRALGAIMLGKKLTKTEQKSNWAQEKLTQGQINYAARDAAIGLEIYHKFFEKY